MIISKEICDELSDVELVQQSLLNIDYFSCLFEKYEASFLRYIRRISMVNNDEAEDILQDSFLKIWKNLNDYDSSLKLSSWLYRIVHNETISYWRKKKSYGKDNVVNIEDNLYHLESDETNIFEELEDSDNQKLKQALQDINLNYRDILILRYYEGLSYIEISDVLKIPEGTVAIRISRAKKALLLKFKDIKN